MAKRADKMVTVFICRAGDFVMVDAIYTQRKNNATIILNII